MLESQRKALKCCHKLLDDLYHENTDFESGVIHITFEDTYDSMLLIVPELCKMIRAMWK